MLLFLLSRSIISDWEENDPRHRILKREQKLVNILYDMEAKGLPSLPEKIKGAKKRHEKIINEANEEFASIADKEDFNINSPDQL